MPWPSRRTAGRSPWGAKEALSGSGTLPGDGAPSCNWTSAWSAPLPSQPMDRCWRWAALAWGGRKEGSCACGGRTRGENIWPCGGSPRRFIAWPLHPMAGCSQAGERGVCGCGRRLQGRSGSRSPLTPAGGTPSRSWHRGGYLLRPPRTRRSGSGTCAQGRRSLSLKGHSSNVYDLALAKGGKLLASAGDDRSVRLWDTDSGKQLLSIAFANRVGHVVFTPDGKTVVTGDHDGMIKLWSVAELLSHRAKKQ